ncbi:pro-sigmaK processing inhibitor BofA family protein [Candidatus Micrarchaeota archaeon]|nr:pro-sigmaK processing inhibitor BofA family protein [Candidatus Micrarchaeota archaeon]
MVLLAEIGAVLTALFLLYLLWRFLKNPAYVVANSVLGIAIFLVLDALGLGIPINIFSIGVVAIGGLSGVLLVLLIHYLGLGF